MKSLLRFWFFIALFTFVSACKSTETLTDAQISSAATPSSTSRNTATLTRDFDLNDFKGKTFLDAMQEKISDNMHKDTNTEIAIPPFSSIKGDISMFEDAVFKKAVLTPVGGLAALQAMVDRLNSGGKKSKPKELYKLVGGFDQSPSLAILFGAGVKVKIDSKNSFYNVGYYSPEVKSGRSFGISSNRGARDPSDNYYLTELNNYLKDTAENPSDLYRAMLKSIISCDGGGWRKLSDAGQTVATDFLAIYTAELDRNMMVNLSPVNHPWQNDLAEASFISAFVRAAGFMIEDGKIIHDSNMPPTRVLLTAFFDRSASGNGSGIGVTRKDRRALQLAVAKVAIKNAEGKKLADALNTLVGGGRGKEDPLQNLMEYLNKASNQSDVRKNADKIIDATVAYVDFIREKYKLIDEASVKAML